MALDVCLLNAFA
ncbi:hypothetical protein DLR59_18325 [Vibrio tarriae]|nr:hypothetical protein [Vibrio cholerae]RBM24671.1 hypothetical protein DLR59_18325 [Vibrio tarriae]